jgi:starch synthase
MPLYGDIPKYLRDGIHYITNFTVPVAWRRQYCGLYQAEYDGVTFYFIDNDYYFNRKGLYGFYDDAERFSFFSRAILEMLPYIDFHPDLIHTNDWQTSLVSTYYYFFYSKTLGIAISRACLLYTIFSIRVCMAGRLTRSVLVFLLTVQKHLK